MSNAPTEHNGTHPFLVVITVHLLQDHKKVGSILVFPIKKRELKVKVVSRLHSPWCDLGQ